MPSPRASAQVNLQRSSGLASRLWRACDMRRITETSQACGTAQPNQQRRRHRCRARRREWPGGPHPGFTALSSRVVRMRGIDPDRHQTTAMAKDFAVLEDSNPSSNPSIHDVSTPSRRTVLRGGLGLTISGLLAPLAGCAGLGVGRGTRCWASRACRSARPIPWSFLRATARRPWLPGASRWVCRPRTTPSASMPATPRPSRKRRWACTTMASTSFAIRSRPAAAPAACSS
jgi:hypothetical protein